MARHSEEMHKKDLFLLNNMIKLGQYSDDQARVLIADLSKAKIKYDTRIHFMIDHIKLDCLEGRFSELKEVLKDTQKIEKTVTTPANKLTGI